MATAAGRYYVYALFREDGRPFYIGKGKDNRWTDHEYLARTGARGYRYNLIRYMLSRDIEIPKVKLHEGLTEAVAHAYEAALIAAVGRYPNGPLLNFTNGGEGASGRKPTPRQLAGLAAGRTVEAFAKAGAAKRGVKLGPRSADAAHYWRGRKHSAATLEKLRIIQRARAPSTSAFHTGRRHSPEHIANQAAAQRGKKLSEAHKAKLRGPKTPEHRAKLRKPKTPEHKAKLRAAALAWRK